MPTVSTNVGGIGAAVTAPAHWGLELFPGLKKLLGGLLDVSPLLLPAKRGPLLWPK